MNTEYIVYKADHFNRGAIEYKFTYVRDVIDGDEKVCHIFRAPCPYSEDSTESIGFSEDMDHDAIIKHFEINHFFTNPEIVNNNCIKALADQRDSMIKKLAAIDKQIENAIIKNKSELFVPEKFA